MRLDAETASSTYVENIVANAAVNERSIEANNALREGIRAAQAGDRAKARTALLRASELDPQSESAWLWLASISEYPEELVVFLNNVLDINPNNARAIEWMAATKGLLAKTFVQRGIDAMDGGQKELATQYFDQALEHDQKNTTAWLWLANLADSNVGKLSYLEKVLECEPDNAAAKAAYDQAKHEINQALLAEARAAAVAGRKSESHELLDAFIAENPESEDGWILRSHLADGFADKIAAFEKVLSINPDNLVARSGLDSLKAIMQTVQGTARSVAPEPELAEPETMENTAFAVEQERIHETEANSDKSPTQELEFPEAAFALAAQHEAHAEEGAVEVPSFDETPAVAETVPSTDAGVDWSMNTVSFSFAFPGGEGEPLATTEDAVENDSFEFSVNGTNHHPVDAIVEPIRVVEESAPVVSFDISPEQPQQGEMGETFAFVPSLPEPEAVTEVSIPMPANFDAEPAWKPTGFETNLVREETAAPQAAAATSACPYCGGEIPSQAFTCGNCLATLTLADVEMMLANTHADKTLVRSAIERLEDELRSREFAESDLTVLGIGHLNLRNFQAGYDYLLEASQLSPNNFVLASQVNALHIRLEEIKDQEAAQETTPKGKSILVVDDSATVRKLIAGKLEKCGHEVYCAADGVEALEQLDSVLPDLILLDITMPRMDGYQVCKVIRSKESTKDIPVVMISGKDGFFDKVRGRMAGTTGYITKPFGPETLMKAVETYLKGQVETGE